MTQGGKRLVAGLGWGSFLPVLLIALLTLGWELLAWQNFGYPLLHRWLSIGVTIDEQKEVIRIIVSEEQSDLIFETIYLAGQLDKPGRGIMYMSRLDRVATYIPESL